MVNGHAAVNSNGHSNGPTAARVPSWTYQTIQETVSYIKSRCSLQPQVVMVLGSGLGPIADAVQDATIIPYTDIPNFHAPGVQGHPGRLVIGKFNGVPALVLQVRAVLSWTTLCCVICASHRCWSFVPSAVFPLYNLLHWLQHLLRCLLLARQYGCKLVKDVLTLNVALLVAGPSPGQVQ